MGERAKGPEPGRGEASEEGTRNISGIHLCQKKVGLHPCFQKYQYFNVHLDEKEGNRHLRSSSCVSGTLLSAFLFESREVDVIFVFPDKETRA